jgi:hypothetical protein
VKAARSTWARSLRGRILKRQRRHSGVRLTFYTQCFAPGTFRRIFEYPSTPEASAPELRRFLVKKNSLDKSVGIALAAVLSCGTVFMAPAALAQAAQTDTAKASTPDPNAPRLAIKEEKIDVGTVAKGEQIHQVFIIKNTGKSDLLITDVKPLRLHRPRVRQGHQARR